ncbi:MAG: ribose-phosphate pyrophosphokinase, partial [Muribaculaceae bacterium]|nr:ribose-phosphate pyrophosphokinase [Muribaculaceae bacterium]
LMIDAAKRASAKSVTAVIPYFGWARQDRKDKPRVSIAAKLVAEMLQAASVDSLITMDLHADQIQGFFNIPVNHLYASSVFIPYIKKLKLKDLVIASPDVGGAKRANNYAKYFKTPLVLCHKQRARANVVEKMTIIGDVVDKNVILIDDMIDTAGTICTAANLMKKNGARSVRAVASHAIMSDPASERINESALDEVIFSDSIPFDLTKSDKVSVVTVAGLIADTILRIHRHESISSQYIL